MIDVPVPQPGPGEVRVRVEAGALNAADVKVLEQAAGAGFVHGKASPHVVGYDFAGTVDALGAGVQGRKEGERVFGFLPYAPSNKSGSFAELILADAPSLGVFPDGVSATDAAAAATAGVTALTALRDKGNLKEGGRVLVHGASGGVGAYAVQVARALGAGFVVGTASEAKADFVRSLGVDEVVDHRQTSVPDLEGPFDVFFDAAAVSSFAEAKNTLSPTGVYVTLLPSLSFVTGKIASLFSSRGCAFVAVQSVPADLEQMARWLADGTIRSPVRQTFTLKETRDALALLHAGKATGKIAITVGD